MAPCSTASLGRITCLFQQKLCPGGRLRVWLMRAGPVVWSGCAGTCHLSWSDVLKRSGSSPLKTACRMAAVGKCQGRGLRLMPAFSPRGVFGRAWILLHVALPGGWFDLVRGGAVVPGCWGAAERAVPRESLSRAPLRHKTELAGAGAPREPGAPRAEQRSSQARSLPPDSSDTISVLYWVY